MIKKRFCALLAIVMVVGMLSTGLTGCANSNAPTPEETEPKETIPQAERFFGDMENEGKLLQDAATKSISLTQLATAEAAPSFTFYNEGVAVEGKQWAIRGKIQMKTEPDKEGQICFFADMNSENQASIIVSRNANGINGVYQNHLLGNVRTPEEGNRLVSRSLTDTTDWSAEFAFVFIGQAVSLYLKEPGEDFLHLASIPTTWTTCTAKFSLLQNADVTISDVSVILNHVSIKTMCQKLIAPLENPIDSKRILFIGNSGTAYKNVNVPELFTHLARNAGYNIDAGAVVLGNSSFAHHADATTGHGKAVLAEIAKGYEIVFLQELSSCICSEANRQLTLDSSKILDAAIRAAGSQTAFYSRAPMRKDTYAGQNTLTQCYEYDKLFTDVSKEIGAANVSVTRAYDYVIRNSYINLWVDDNVHANDEGEYLTVCVFFASLFNESATVLDYDGLDEEVAKFLQEAADKVVFENYTIPGVG